MPENHGQNQGHTISWQVITHTHRERSVDWYWALGVAAVLSAALSIWLGNFLFAIILLIGAGSMGALMARGPREHSVRLDNRGLSIDGTRYAYRSLKSFWVDSHGEHYPLKGPRLYLTHSGVLSPHIMLPLDDVSQGQQVRSLLRQAGVEEKEQEPHFGEHVAELLGL